MKFYSLYERINPEETMLINVLMRCSRKTETEWKQVAGGCGVVWYNIR